MINENLQNQYTADILIIDDVPANLKVLGDILKTIGYKVRPVPNGRIGIKAAENVKPDLILLDIMMPDMDGYEVCRILKESPDLHDIPIIFISALNDTSDIVKALKAGGVDYIVKPFQAEEVEARVSTHLKIRRQSQELTRLNIDKDRFISILAHDLKNPFHALLGLSQLLSANIHQYEKEQIETFASNINKSALRTYNLLEDLLMWARSQSGKIPFNRQKFSVSEICKSIIVDSKLVAGTKNITVNFSTEDEIIVSADIDMFKTIMRNLISNSIKFTTCGGEIDIRAKHTNSEITVSVADNGIGMKPDMLKRLFDISHTHTRAGTENESGTGLGLLLCKDFVEYHGGSIWAESEVDAGTVFYFTIPDFNESK